MADPLRSCADARARLELLRDRTPIVMPSDVVPDEFRRAAVLFLVGCLDGEPALVLTERGAHLRTHASQIALPGGRIEPDETPETAALREAEEEVGVVIDDVVVLGRLDEAWSGAGNHVTTVVGWYDGVIADLAPASHEVARVFIPTLEQLAHRDAFSMRVVEHRGLTYHDERITVDDLVVFGLTADLVLDLLAWLGGEDRGRVPYRAEALTRWIERQAVD